MERWEIESKLMKKICGNKNGIKMEKRQRNMKLNRKDRETNWKRKDVKRKK